MNVRTPRLRVSLTLWHVAAMVIVLAIYAAGVYAFFSRSVSQALDDRLRGDFIWAAEMWEKQPDGTLSWFDASDAAWDEDSPWLQVWSDGELVFRTALARRNPIARAAELVNGRPDADGVVTAVASSGHSYRVLTRPAHIADRQVVIQVARSRTAAIQELRELTMFLALALPFGVAAAGFGGYALAQRALRPIERMTEQAQRITAARLSDRLPVARADDELGRLAVVFNDTLERLERSFTEMQQFTGDVSHQLRTPLTAMRMVGEIGLREASDVNRSAVIASMLEEVDRLTLLVERLLTLSRAGSAHARLAHERVNLSALATEVAADLSVLADEKRQALVVEGHSPLFSRADPLTLRQALINLVDNAIKYSPIGSRIELRVAAASDKVVIEVSDRGPGVDEQHAGGIFDRFYRGSSARAAAHGTGLGLAISKWAVEASQGHLVWEGRPGGGSTFRIVLPQTVG